MQQNITFNLNVRDYIEKMSAYYFILKDYGRSNFYKEALQELSLFEMLDLNNIELENFKEHLSKSKKFKKIAEEIKVEEYTQVTSNRKNQLIKDNPWITYAYFLKEGFPLLDLDELKEIVAKNSENDEIYKAIKEKANFRSNQAYKLDQLTTERYNFISNQHDSASELSPLGLFLVGSSFSGDDLNLKTNFDSIKSTNIKHIFAADEFESPNTFLGLNRERFLRRKKTLDSLEVEYQIKTYKGVILDLDKKGTPIIDNDLLDCVDFVILDIKTKPHYNLASRIEEGLKHLKKQKNRIILNTFDKYSYLDDLDKIESLIIKENLIINIEGTNHFGSDLFLDILHSFDRRKIRAAFCGIKAKERLMERYTGIARDPLLHFRFVYSKYQFFFLKSQVINFNSNPFSLVQSSNRVGLKEDGVCTSNLNSNSKSGYSKRLEKLRSSLTLNEDER